MRLAAVFVVAFACTGLAGSAFAAEDVTKTLSDLEAKWSAASLTHDVKTVDTIVAADWIGRGWKGDQSDKAKLLKDIADKSDKLTAIKNHDVVVRAFGDIAVVQGYDDETGSLKGKDTSGTYSWTDVFQKRNGQWVAIASQNTKVLKKGK